MHSSGQAANLLLIMGQLSLLLVRPDLESTSNVHFGEGRAVMLHYGASSSVPFFVVN